jgi:predicted acylesterase/phospholipase RssA
VFLSFLETPKIPTREEIEECTLRDFLREINIKFMPDALEDRLDDALVNALATSSNTVRIFSFLEWGGFYAADNFLSWLKDKLNEGVYAIERGSRNKGEPRDFGGMTLAEFYTATGVDLSLVAADTTDSRLLILNHRTAPDCPVIYGVRMSMSLPLLWQEVVWKPEWGKYRDRDISGHSIVDGGMLSNFPIELFLSNQPHITAVMGEKVVADLDVLGFLIDETIEVPGAPVEISEAKAFDVGQLNTVTRLKNLINTMTQAHDKSVIEASQRFVVRLPAKTYGTIEFGMTDQRREALIAAGRDATAKYFDRTVALEGIAPSFGLDFAEMENLSRSADFIATGILNR